MRILALDIETAPNLAYVWGLYKQNISPDKITNSGYVLCWAAKWVGEREPVRFDSVHASPTKRMLRGIHALLDEADAVLTYYGDNFDLPTLSKEFVTHGFQPPSPFRRIDLCAVVQRRFRFASTKLDFVCQALGLGAKVRHTGFDLWRDCMAGDAKAWRLMERYNKQDVVILERLYHRLLPWIPNHPNRAVYAGERVCPQCSGTRLLSRGLYRTSALTYRRLRCQNCGAYSRERTALKGFRGTPTAVAS